MHKCMNAYLDVNMYICRQTCMDISVYVCLYVFVCVAAMSMNATGMSIHPFQWNFYVLAGEYLHYSIFDDVIMSHH